MNAPRDITDAEADAYARGRSNERHQPPAGTERERAEALDAYHRGREDRDKPRTR